MRLKISLPTYGKDTWESLQTNGHLEVEGEADNLCEGYNELKIQIENLLEQVNAENRLACRLEDLNEEVDAKERDLKILMENIERLKNLKESLVTFLKGFGVDPKMTRLTFDNEILLESALPPAVAAEVVEHDPIPFNSGEDRTPHEF